MVFCRARGRLCALPLTHVAETMRPLPIEPFGGAPAFVKGVSIVRGEPLPIVDLGALLGLEGEAAPSRLLTLRVGERHLALAVEAVLGIREVDTSVLEDVPPLLGDGVSDMVATLSALEGELLLVLRAGRLLPESMWAELEHVETAR